MRDYDRGVDYYFNSGATAHSQGYSRDSCQFLFNAYPRQAWEMGWDYCELKRAVEAGERPLGERVNKPPEYQGRNAYQAGISVADCPYGPDTQNAKLWRLGWNIEQAADLDDQKRYDIWRHLALAGIFIAVALLAFKVLQ